MKNDLKYALDRNNTTAGKLSDVLGVVQKRDARIAELEAENRELSESRQQFAELATARLERIEELEAELKWAWDNMRFTSPEPAEDYEYDFCLVCCKPEWKHDQTCTAKQHQEKSRRLLEER